MRLSTIFQIAVMQSAAHAESFDFIVVGGGAAGLTVASRLSEVNIISILVLEAGNDHTDDITVECPGCFATLYGNPEYDWNYENVPQPSFNGRVHRNIAGKGLGGGSSVNFLYWTPNSQKNVNNWGALGNEGWSWDEFQPYLKKSETFVPLNSSRAQQDLETYYVDLSVHGTNGPIVNSFPEPYGPLLEAWPRAYANLGAGVDGDPRGGLASGGYTNPFNIDPKTTARSYPANTILQTALKRGNLRVITGAFVTKLLFDTARDRPHATGVTYQKNNQTYAVTARREVILSAGSMQSSKLLELSGIGNASLLDQLGIDCLVENPGVGENFQNHLMLPFGFAVKPGIATGDDLAANNGSGFAAAKAQYAASRTGPLTTVNGSSALLTLAQINTTMQDLAPYLESNNTPAHLADQYALLTAGLATDMLVQDISVGAGIMPWYYNDSAKVFASPGDGGNYLTIISILAHPFSRGSVHAQSTDPLVQARLDPRYLSHPVDMELSRRLVSHVLEVARAHPLTNLLLHGDDGLPVVQPGYPSAAALMADEASVDAFIREYMLIAYHHSGNCAMMPRDKGGVVDARLRVYGVYGLRVVDASVLPLMPQATLTSTIVGLAERAADFIKEDYYV